jgi:hypothetical protein
MTGWPVATNSTTAVGPLGSIGLYSLILPLRLFEPLFQILRRQYLSPVYSCCVSCAWTRLLLSTHGMDPGLVPVPGFLVSARAKRTALMIS